jgi:hypothetical protein
VSFRSDLGTEQPPRAASYKPHALSPKGVETSQIFLRDIHVLQGYILFLLFCMDLIHCVLDAYAYIDEA